MGFLDDYEPVEDRLRAFWEQHPVGRIVTELLYRGDGEYVVKATVYRGDEVRAEMPAATGLAQEQVTQRGVNATSALENCETSAIGRALANLGYAAKGKRPSREEMSKASAPSSPSPEPTTGSPSSVTSGRDGSAERGAGKGDEGEAPSDPAPQSTPSDGSDASDMSAHPGKRHVWKPTPDFPNYEACTVGKCRAWRYVGKDEEATV